MEVVLRYEEELVEIDFDVVKIEGLLVVVNAVYAIAVVCVDNVKFENGVP